MKETERMYLCLSQERIIQFQVSRWEVSTTSSWYGTAFMDDEKIYYGCSVKMAYIPKFFLWMQSKIDVKKKFKNYDFGNWFAKQQKPFPFLFWFLWLIKGEGGGDFSSRAMQMICVGFSKLITEHRLCIPNHFWNSFDILIAICAWDSNWTSLFFFSTGHALSQRAK